MRVPWGKLKINPLGALSQSHHHQHGAASDASRNVNASTNNTQTSPAPGAPKSRWNLRGSSRTKRSTSGGAQTVHQQEKGDSVKVDIVEEENSDLLGEIVMSGTLSIPGKLLHSAKEVTAKLTAKAFLWSLHCVRLDDIVAVSCYDDSERITVHSFAILRTRWVPETFGRARRSRTDLHFTAATKEEALGWAAAFAHQGVHVNFLPNPITSKKGHTTSAASVPSRSAKEAVKSRPSPKMLVVLNPKSGRGRAGRVFRNKVQPVLELAGFKLSVVETTGARHAQTMAMQLDLTTCPDGIICVGGDGIINEVLNGLLSRDDADQACATPIGIIPAGSDNSLVWTVLGVKDPTTAAVAIVKGGTVATDVFSVEWTKTGATYMGHTVAYYGFMSDVLELSAKYQGRFGPLRYFVAGVIRLLTLPRYKCEVQFLPAETPAVEVRIDKLGDSLDLESVDHKGLNFESQSEIVVESGMDNHDGKLGISATLKMEADLFGPLDATNEPSDYVRGLDGKTKRSPSAKSSSPASHEEAVAVHPMSAGASPSPRSRSRSKSRSDRGLSVLSAMAPKPLRKSKSSQRIAEISVSGSCLGDNLGSGLGRRWGPLEGAFDLKAGTSPTVQPVSKPREPTSEDWVVRQGPFLGVMICNHQCKTVQCLESQAMAPLAEHDDGTMDLLMVRSVGRLKLLRFIIAMQFNRHLSLPFVEYTKVRSVALEPSKKGHLRCGIDGELLTLDGPILSSVMPFQCHLIGKAKKHS
ncbi:hypothetical protein R1sor_027320 [Riccia sorocarpa]|uniref:DAGKc domain-containing protein n=1 Tax=Riccia sorocarpa TaxID=122646 RepID=A0ABD3GDU8_9MARC